MSTFIRILASAAIFTIAIGAINIGEHLGGGWDFWLTIVGVLICYFFGHYRASKLDRNERSTP